MCGHLLRKSLSTDKLLPEILQVSSLMAGYIATIAFFVEENPDWKPCISTDLESVLNAAECLHLFWSQFPAIELEVGLDS